MKVDRKKLRRVSLITGLVGLVLFGLNHLMTFPMAFRDGDLKKWLGPGPAGKPLRRVYSLVEITPERNESPRAEETLTRLKTAEMAEDRGAYPTSVSLGDYKYWESNRRALIAPPLSTISYQVTIPPGAVLDFGYALGRYPKKPKGYPKKPETTFVIEWRDADGTRELFRKTVKLSPPGFWERDKERARFYRMYVDVGLKRTKDMFRDERLDLSALAGRTGTLSFITAGPDKQSEACPPALWAAPEIWAERPAAEPVPVNVVIFMIEATSARMLPPAPGNPGVTPNLAAFADQAAAFDRFFVVGDSTKLSTVAFFTGRHYKSMGLPDDVYFLAPIVKERFYRRQMTSLPEAFSRAGYTSVEIGTNHYVQPTRDFGLDVGFDRIDIMGRRYYAHVDTMLAAAQWLRQNGSKPFVLYLHYDSPHQEDKPCIEDLLRVLTVPTDDRRWKFRKHLAQLSRADLDFGNLLAALEQLGVRDRTLIAVTSDHGNCLNPANAFTIIEPGKDTWDTPFVHGQAMAFEDINPPLLVDWPIGPKGAVRSSAPLMSIDLFPTLTQLVLKDLDPDTAARMSEIEGKSFASIMDPTFGPTFPGHEVTYTLSMGGEMIVSGGRWHYVSRTPERSRLLYHGQDRLRVYRERLFDINQDPLEAHDLIEERPELAEEMRAKLKANRPAEAVMSILFFNYPGGRVRGILAVAGGSGGTPAAATFPESRKPIVLNKLSEDPATGTVLMSFEADLEGPTGLMLDDTVKWVWVMHGGTEVSAAELRVGRFGLPLLSAGGAEAPAVTLPDGRLVRPVMLGSLAPGLLRSEVHPTFYSAEAGTYFYQMTFANLIARNYTDQALSSGVRSILKEWGYIR